MNPKDPSVFNDILGPVMRGPSSSHTAGSFHIAFLARALLGDVPARARFLFDPAGSYAQVYQQQGVDRAFAAGLLGWEVTDPRFVDALAAARASGLDLRFEIASLPGADHPNTTDIELVSRGGAVLRLRARSVGGGAIEIVRIDDWPVALTGDAWCVVAEVPSGGEAALLRVLDSDGASAGAVAAGARSGRSLIVARRWERMAADARREASRVPGLIALREAPPIAFGKPGAALFSSCQEMLELAGANGWSMGRAALAYEAALLGLDEELLRQEMMRRFAVMRRAVEAGLSPSAPAMRLLKPSARRVLDAEAAGQVAIGGLHTRAAARAMAVMHVNGAMGVVCAAPTGGSAGVIPGVMVTLAEERRLSDEVLTRSLFAAGAVGLVVASRATFAAEVAGCQVEIGAAGAMAAAAVVESAGGTARQAADAAAIAFQNTMGSVCDLVQGMVEIPCHTRNAAAAASAFVCADLVMGGYENPIGLDETIDAVYAVGRLMPSELRCTARGGLAVTPTALRMREK